eukprot:5334169-Pyramimonas_sp.AAC.1
MRSKVAARCWSLEESRRPPGREDQRLQPPRIDGPGPSAPLQRAQRRSGPRTARGGHRMHDHQ